MYRVLTLITLQDLCPDIYSITSPEIQSGSFCMMMQDVIGKNTHFIGTVYA